MSLIDTITSRILSEASKGLLNSPIKDFNAFAKNIGTTLTPNGPSNTSTARPAKSNAYSRENALQRFQSRGDPVLSFDWIGVILDPSLSVQGQLPWFYIDGLTTPSVSVDVHQMYFNGVNKKFASVFNTDSITLKLYTDVKSVSFNYADYWTRSTYRKDGYYNLPSRYKKDIVVYILDATRSVVVDLRFIGCFPTSWDSYNLGSDNSILETSLTLSVDEFFMSYETDPTSSKESIGKLFQNNKPVTKLVESTLGTFSQFRFS